MCSIDGDPPSFYREERRKARKVHTCEECGRQIEAGERYRFVSGMWNGHVGEHKACAHCDAAQRLLVKHCDGYMLGCLREELAEHIEEYLPWSISAARMMVGVKRHWKRVRGDGLISLEYIGRVVERSSST